MTGQRGRKRNKSGERKGEKGKVQMRGKREGVITHNTKGEMYDGRGER